MANYHFDILTVFITLETKVVLEILKSLGKGKPSLKNTEKLWLCASGLHSHILYDINVYRSIALLLNVPVLQVSIQKFLKILSRPIKLL